MTGKGIHRKSPVQPGSPLRIRAATWNTLLEMASEWGARQKTGGGSHPMPETSPVVVRFKNTLTQSLKRFAVVPLHSTAINPAKNEGQFLDTPILKVGEHQKLEGLTGIVRRPVAAGAVGTAVILGLTPARIDIKADTDWYAERVLNDYEKLKSSVGGSIRIVYKPAGTGIKKCLVVVTPALQAGKKFFRTPQAGVPGRIMAGVPGSAMSERMRFDAVQGSLQPENPPVFEKTWNLAPGSVRGNDFVQCGRIDGEWFVDVEYCS